MQTPNKTQTPIKSAWPSPKGKPLTDHRILYYAALGRYGREWQLAIAARKAEREIKARRKKRELKALFAEYSF